MRISHAITALMHHPLQQTETKGKKPGVGGTDCQRFAADSRLSHLKSKYCQLLSRQPGKGLFAELLKGVSEALLKSRFVRRFIIRNEHTVGVPPAHVRIDIIRTDPVLDPHYVELMNLSAIAIRQGIADLPLTVLRPAACKGFEFFNPGGDFYPRGNLRFSRNLLSTEGYS